VNRRLTPVQIDEIREAAWHVDVPADELLAAAAEIRAVLLGASDQVSRALAPPRRERGAATRRHDPARRARVLRTSLVAAAHTMAVVLTAAVGGALPEPIQTPVARVGNLFGINLPNPDQTRAVDTTSGSHNLTSAPNAPGSSRGGSGGSNGADDDAGLRSQPESAGGTTESKSSSSPPASRSTTTVPGPDAGAGTDHGADPGGPGVDKGNGDGPPENPGNGNGNGYANGPTQNNGNGNANGPSENNGNGNGNANGPSENNGNATGNPHLDGGSDPTG
jgi:hypothetical protein